jgi:hypothetical protein
LREQADKSAGDEAGVYKLTKAGLENVCVTQWELRVESELGLYYEFEV